eukprot:COSAG01_NODE_3395_length_6148_cov_1.985948_2_plen_202_part_00
MSMVMFPLGDFANHDDDPNMRIDLQRARIDSGDAVQVLAFKAKRAIEAGDEIFNSYMDFDSWGPSNWHSMMLWGFVSPKSRAQFKVARVGKFMVTDSIEFQGSQQFLNFLGKQTRAAASEVDEVAAAALGEGMVEQQIGMFTTTSKLESTAGDHHEALVALVKDELEVLHWWVGLLHHIQRTAQIESQSLCVDMQPSLCTC